MKVKVSDLLSAGKGRAVKCADLARMLGVPRRTVRRMVQRERLEGVPILSDCENGFYLPGNEDETAEFVSSMRHRADMIDRSADAVENSHADSC